MSAGSYWRIAASVLFVLGINLMAADGWHHVVGAGVIGGAVGCLGSAIDASIRARPQGTGGKVAAATSRPSVTPADRRHAYLSALILALFIAGWLAMQYAT